MRSLRLPILSVALLSAACFSSAGDAAGEAAQAGGALSANAGAAKAARNPQARAVPSFETPETRSLFQERLVKVRRPDDQMEVYVEELQADGAGNFRVDLRQYAAIETDPLIVPAPGERVAIHDWRQRYLVNHRDLRISDPSRAARNYLWREVPGSHSMAGRSVRVYTGRSNFGLGSVEFSIDEAEGVLLGWILRDEQGETLSSLETLAVNFQYQPGTVQWATPNVPDMPYRGKIDDPILGVAPLVARYAPPGFRTVESRIVLNEGNLPQYPELPNLHLEILSDGVQTFFIGQHRVDTLQTPGGFASYLARTIDLGGVRVMEGAVHGRQVILVGTMPHSEAMAVFGSMSLPQ